MISLPASPENSASKVQDSVVAEMISAVDSPEYPRIALHALNRLVPVDAAAMFIYAGDDLVYLLDDELTHLVDSHFVSSYRQFTYRYSPFFQHHKIGLSSGAYTMGELARTAAIKIPSTKSMILELDDTEEIGYRTRGFPKHCSELAIAIRLSPFETVQIAMYRCGFNAFDGTELARLKGINETMGALYNRFWRHQEMYKVSDSNIFNGALQGLSNGALSAREREVLLLDLNGSDARSIGQRLGISEETVKTHRKRGFGKVGVNSKSDLFLAVLRRIVARSSL